MRIHSYTDYFTSDELIVVKYRKTSNAIKLHQHDFTELVCVVKGSGIHKIGEDAYVLSGGSLFLIPPDVAHMISFSADTEYYDILIRQELFDRLPATEESTDFDIVGDCRQVVVSHSSSSAYPEMCGLLRLLYREYTNSQAGSRRVLQSVLEILLVHLLRNRGTTEEITEESRRLALPQVLDYINSHFTEPLKLYDIATMYHYSPNAFSKLFRKKFGMNFREYLHLRRIDLAKDQLSLGNNTVLEVCRAVGYTNTNEFYRIFRKYTGKSPLEYRRNKEVNRTKYDLNFMTEEADKS